MIADPVSTRHCSSPVAASSAYRVPSVLPAYSVLPITTGRPFTADPLSSWDHLADPSAVLSAMIVPPVGTNSVDAPYARSAVMPTGTVTCQVALNSCGSGSAGSAVTYEAAGVTVPAATFRPT